MKILKVRLVRGARNMKSMWPLGGHLFYDLFSHGRGGRGHVPLGPHLDPLLCRLRAPPPESGNAYTNHNAMVMMTWRWWWNANLRSVKLWTKFITYLALAEFAIHRSRMPTPWTVESLGLQLKIYAIFFLFIWKGLIATVLCNDWFYRLWRSTSRYIYV